MSMFRNTLALALLLATGLVHAADVDAGRKKVESVCAACHGLNGISVDKQYPVLAGQHEEYIKKALHDYKRGNRSNPIMAGLAQQLSEADIDNVAAYFSQLAASPLNQAR